MRRRWHISETFKWALITIYGFIWLPIFIILNAVCNKYGLNDPGMALAPTLFISLWVGVPAFLGGVYGLVKGLQVIWRERPRRVVDPVTTDLRKAER